jgi:hypothetical protein
MPLAIEPASQAEDIRPGSDRNFGLVFAAVFGVIGAWPLVGAHAPRWWALVIAGAFAIVALAKPDLLRPLNWVWFRFGILLARIMNPLVMGAVFFLCVTPMGWIMRLAGKDLLAQRWSQASNSYWIMREPSGPAPESMKRQF